MSWLEKLYRTYENNTVHITDELDSKHIPLLAVGETLLNAQVTISLDQGGTFRRAILIPPEDSSTIIPATEESAGRTAGRIPHPLSDTLRYVASDFYLYLTEAGIKDSEKEREKEKKFHYIYVNQLENWYSLSRNQKIAAVLKYVKNSEPISDLLKDGVLIRDTKGKIVMQQGKTRISLDKIVVRWRVEIDGNPQSELWRDSEIWESWTDYYTSIPRPKGLCYTTGKEEILTKNHPKIIRNRSDQTKLISVPTDATFFTYQGRFTQPEQALGISYEVSQKAHHALRWLISKQGYHDDTRVFVAWAVSGLDVPSPFIDSLGILEKYLLSMSLDTVGYTAPELGAQLAKCIAGYTVNLGKTDEIVVLGLNSVDNKQGRLAITFYRELSGSEFLGRLESWHDPNIGCTWWQELGNGKRFFGAPSPRSIAEVAYGIGSERRKLTESEKKLRSSTVERLLPCITDSVKIPLDIVESCVRRASHRLGSRYGNDDSKHYYWQWEKALSVACALFRYYNKERRYSMSLERERKTRDYLFGRLLALGERLEESAMSLSDEKRETNAARLMQRFSDRPYSTWLTIEKQLAPYIQRLKTKRPGLLTVYKREMDEIHAAFEHDEYCLDKQLSGEFLLGFHCQRADLNQGKSNDTGNEKFNDEENNEEEI